MLKSRRWSVSVTIDILTTHDDAGGRIDAILFNAFDGPLGQTLSEHNGARFHVAGRLEIDDWGGRKRPKLRMEDAKWRVRQ